MSLENWLGVASDIVDVISFFSKILAEDKPGSPRSSTRLMMGSVQFFVEDGTIKAQNIGNANVSMSLFGDPTSTGSEPSPTLLAPDDTVDFTALVNAQTEGNGIVSLAVDPTAEQRRSRPGVGLGLRGAVTVGRHALGAIAGMTLMSGVKADYDSSNKRFAISFSGETGAASVCGIINSVGGVISSVFSKKKDPVSGSGDDTQVVYLAVPDDVADAGEFASVTFVIFSDSQ